MSAIQSCTRLLLIVFLVSGQLLASSVSLAWNPNTETDLAGYWVYRSQTSGSSYVRINTSLVTSPSFVDTTAAAGTTYYYTVSAVNTAGMESGKSNEVQAVVPAPTPTNNPPTVNAGADKTVTPGAAVTLTGSATDPNGDPLTYSWSQTSGPSVSLSGASTATASFTAPSVTTDTTLGFRLTANDGKGGTASDDVSVLVDVTVNSKPVANAGPDQTVAPGATVTLQCSSTDPDGDALTRAWTQISGPAVTLQGATTATCTFTAPSVTTSTTLGFRLTVSDGKAGSSTDDVLVTVNPGMQGILSGSLAAAPATVNLSTEGTMDWAHWGLTSTSSFDHKAGVTSLIRDYTVIGSGPVQRQLQSPTSYTWTDGTPTASATSTPTGVYLIGSGNGFQLTLPADTTKRTLKLYLGVWDAQGKLEATLSDGSASALSDTSLVNQTATSNGVYTLNYQAGAAGQTLTVKWTAQAVFHSYGNVTLQAATLTGTSGSSVNNPPVANAGGDLSVLSGSPVSLTGTGTDPDNDPLTFAWSQISGPTVSLSGANTTTVSFSAPGVSRDTYLTLRFKVTDSKNAQATDDVQVRVRKSRGKVVAPATMDGVDPSVEGSFIGIAVLNTSTQTDTVQIAGQTSDGVEQLMKTSVFAPQAQAAFLATAVTQNRTDLVSLKAEADNTDVRGFFMIGRGKPNQLDGVGGELQPDTEIFFPVARHDGVQKAIYFLTNTDISLPANLSIEMVNEAGQVVKTAALQLAPAASCVKSFSALMGGGAPSGHHYLRVTSDVMVQGFELMAGITDFASAAAQRATSVKTLWIPHFVLGPHGEDTELRLINPGSQAVEARLRVYNDQAVLLGTYPLSISARGMNVTPLSQIMGLSAVPSGEPFLTGHMVVEVIWPAQGSANLLGAATFTGTAGRARSTLPMWRQPSSDTLYLHVAQSQAYDLFTGLAVMNPNAAPATVTVRAWDKEGRATAEKTIQVQAGHRVVDLLNQSHLFGPGFQQVDGHLELSSDLPVVSFVVFGDGAGQFLSAVEGQSAQ